MALLQQSFLILIVAVICSGIQQEYYLDAEVQDDTENKNKTGDPDTNDQDEELLPNSNNDTSSYDSDYYQDEKKEYNDDLPLKRRVMTKTPISDKKIVTSSATTLSDVDARTYKTLFTRTTRSSNSTMLNIFKAYEYVYDDDSVSSYQRQLVNLNGHLDFDNSTDIEVVTDGNITMESGDDDITTYDNNTLRYLADFYNLVPAISKHVYLYPPKMKSGSDYIWFVPEKYPCWDLPLVVGRLGQREALANVFRVYYGSLTDVITVGLPEPPIPRRYLVPDLSKTSNKWCAVAPCFGDHTLCVFSDKEISKICDKDYKVTTPNMLEKISIVNTINSIRNSIATGNTEAYSHLPPAANMKQVIYDYDLEEMAKVWLRQCLPGLEPCASLDNNYVSQLECTKCAEHCCVKNSATDEEANCIPMYECFILPVVGCLHAWFANAGKKLSGTDIECGHANPQTFNTVQLIWAKTDKIGCAYGKRFNGDIRIICNFSPGAPFYIESKYYCGLVAHRDITSNFVIGNETEDVTDLNFLASLGVVLNKIHDINGNDKTVRTRAINLTRTLRTSDLDSLNEMYKPGWARYALEDYSNGTMGMIARLVTRYTFIEEGQSRCDLDEPIYIIGEPASRCLEKGHRYNSLCYDFADPNPGYRLTAILAPIALFSLILYDLFSSVMRQTIN